MLFNKDEINVTSHCLMKELAVCEYGLQINRAKGFIDKSLAIANAMKVIQSALFKLNNELKDLEQKDKPKIILKE